MSEVDKFYNELSNYRAPEKKREFQAARQTRLEADWLTSGQKADAILRWNLKTMRERSQNLCRNNSYARGFIRDLKVNINGAFGIKLQMAIYKDALKKIPDLEANAAVEAAVERWGKKKNCTVTGQLSWKDVQDLFMESAARDGDIIVRKIKGFDNEFGFALQPLEGAYLNEDLNDKRSNGNIITMGVEKNSYGRPVAYWLRNVKQDDQYYSAASDSTRMPADDIIHSFIHEYPNQTRGAPWMMTAMLQLRMLGAYSEATTTGARTAASNMGFIIPPESAEWISDDKDAYGNLISEVSAGTLELLPKGADFKAFNPNQPNENQAEFTKTILREAAVGMGTGYNSLARDLEGVSYASLRSGNVQEHDLHRVFQQWEIQELHEQIIPDVIFCALLTKQINRPLSDYNYLNHPTYITRGFDWVDPSKDVQADIAAIEAGLMSRRIVCAKRGYDFFTVIDQLKEENDYAEMMGVSLTIEAPVENKDDDDDSEGKDEKDD